MKKRILSVLISGVLLFGTVFANATSISFEDLERSDQTSDLDIGTDDISMTYEELEIEEATTEENITQNALSPLATEIDFIDEDEEYETKDAISLYSDNYELVSVENWTTVPRIIKGQQMIDMEYLIGHYQFNYTGASNHWTEHGALGYPDSATDKQYNSGVSHLPELSSYEAGAYANSSGAYLDDSYNEGGSIYKAYLLIEFFDYDYNQNYPITLLYGGENGVPINGISTKVSTKLRGTRQYNNDIGWVDITDFVKNNGYGWYYCCNIPDTNIDDQSAEWKILLIEENEKLPIRILKLQFGNVGADDNSWAFVAIKENNITTKKSGTVTGQLLYNISNLDGRYAGKVQISKDT